MTNTKQQELLDRFPKMYAGLERKSTSKSSPMNYMFDIGDGWFDLVFKLSDRLDAIATRFGQSVWYPAVSQVKEKFGALRFYIRFPGDKFPVEKTHEDPVDVQEYVKEIYAAITEAEGESLSICELCGAPGTQKVKTDGSWIRTVCDKEVW